MHSANRVSQRPDETYCYFPLTPEPFLAYRASLALISSVQAWASFSSEEVPSFFDRSRRNDGFPIHEFFLFPYLVLTSVSTACRVFNELLYQLLTIPVHAYPLSVNNSIPPLPLSKHLSKQLPIIIESDQPSPFRSN